MSEIPDLKQIDRAIRQMTPEQFSALCAELGLVEELLGKSRDEQTRTLLSLGGNLNRVARAVRHVWPEAFDPPPVKIKRGIKLPIGPVVGVLALLIIIAVGAWAVASALNARTADIVDYRVTSSPVPTQAVLIGLRTATNTPTPTYTPTRTPTNTPDIPGTLTATYAPSPTPSKTPTRTPTPSRTPRPTRTSDGRPTWTPFPTDTPTPSVAVRVVYPAVLLNKPASGTVMDSTRAFQMTWIVPGLTALNDDERYRLRVRQDQQVIMERVTANNWWDWGGSPNGTPGVYNWSVAVVKVDADNNVLGVISPESERWTIEWK
jgi:hypothetical protein